MSAAEHIMIASGATPLDDPEKIAETLERLDATTIDVALCLIERDWNGAARHAYRAAWHFHRLPDHVALEYIVSDLHDDDGPMPVADDWSASAFVTWLIYRCSYDRQDAGRSTPKPGSYERGRPIAPVPVVSTRGSFEKVSGEQSSFIEADTIVIGKL